jgi:hypothetical protein
MEYRRFSEVINWSASQIQEFMDPKGLVTVSTWDRQQFLT